MSQIRSLYRALFRRYAIYVSKLRFAIVWLGQIQNLDTDHVYVLGLKFGSERLWDRFHLIIPEIRILSSGNQVLEFLFPFNHVYQACSGPGLREVPVDTFQLSGSRKICISFGNLEDENGKTESWRNTYRGVDLKKMRFVPGGFSCTNSPTSCTWRKVVDGYKRNMVSVPKRHIWISRVFATFIPKLFLRCG